VRPAGHDHSAADTSILDTANDFAATDVEGALAELQADAETHAGAADPHTGYRLESATHLDIGTQSDTDAPSVIGYRARDNAGSPEIVASADNLLVLRGYGWDGDSWEESARIEMLAAGTPAAGDVPGALRFHTRAQGGALTQRWSVQSAGNLVTATDSTYDLGTTANRPATVYADTLDASTAVLAKPSGAVAGDVVGDLSFRGNGFEVAGIKAKPEVNTPATGDSPGELVFRTTPDGASTGTDRWRIGSGGALTPVTDSSVNLGSTTFRPSVVYTDTIDVGGYLVTGAGTAFPGSPATNDHFFRTDLRGGMMFFWNGTYWLSAQEYMYDFGALLAAALVSSTFLAYGGLNVVTLPRDLDVYLTYSTIGGMVATTNDGTNYWSAALRKGQINNTWTDVLSGNTSTWNPSGWTNAANGAINQLLDTTGTEATNYHGLVGYAAKTNSPGDFYVSFNAGYRLRAT